MANQLPPGFVLDTQPQGHVFTLPPSPQQQAQAARQAAEADRQARADARAQATFERQQREYNATHYPDGSPKSADGALTPDAIVFNAQQYLATGQMPTLGMGKQAAADREAILNEASRIAGAAGLRGEDLARQIAHYKAGSKQLANLEAQLGTIRANEQAALSNGRLFLDLSSQAPGQSSLTPYNSAVQGLARITGNADVKGMDSAWQTFSTEYAKVIAGSPNGAGTLSDSARHEAMDMIRGNYAPAQKEKAFAAMQADMDNRIAAIHDSINEGYKNLTEKPGYAVPETTSALSAPSQKQDNRNAAGVNISSTTNRDGFGGLPPSLAGGGDASKSLPIPDAMQAEHRDYLQKHYGNLDPQDYAAFRVSLDKKYGFGSDPKGYADITPALNNSMKQGAPVQNLDIPPVNTAMNGLDRFNASVFNNPAGAALIGAGSLAGGSDEIAGTLKSAFTGRPMDEEIARANAVRQASASQFPTSTLLGNIGGTAALGYATGGLLPAWMGEALSTTPGMLAAGAGYGAVNGALENNDNRTGGAVLGGVLGLGGGALGRYAISPVAKGLANSKAGQAVGRGARALFPGARGYTPPVVLQPWERALPGSQAINDIRGNLQDAANYGLPYSLADASPQTRALAGSVARFSPDAAATAKSALEPRFLGQADRAVQAIDTNLAPITNVEQRGKDLIAAGNAAADPYYQMAGDVKTPVDPELQAMLRSSSGQDALARAQSIMSDRGIPNYDKRIFFGPDNLLTTEQTPNFQTLDFVKKGFDSRLESARNPITGKLDLQGDPMLQAVNNLRGRYVAKLDQINPNYPLGRAEFQKYAQRRDALNLGYDTLPNNGVPLRQFQTGVSGLDATTLPEAQMGFATNMADTVNRARLSTNPYHSIYGSPLQQQKVATMFPQGASAFDRIYNLEKDMGETYGEVLKGSQTQPRAMADAQFANEPLSLATDAAMGLATGGHTLPISAARIAGPRIRDRIALGFSQKKADALAPVLFNLDPQATLDLMNQVALRKAQDEARQQAFRRGSGLFGAIAAPSLAFN